VVIRQTIAKRCKATAKTSGRIGRIISYSGGGDWEQRIASGSGRVPGDPLLQRWGQGDREALNSLLPIVHEDLRQLAMRRMRSLPPSSTLQAIQHWLTRSTCAWWMPTA